MTLDETRLQVALNIKSIRVRKNMSQLDIAHKLGISKQTYINYETHGKFRNINTLYSIAEQLNCNISDFFVGL